VGGTFRSFTTVRSRYNLLVCSPSCRIGPDLHPALEDFYYRAFDGLVTHSAAGYCYGGNWAISTGGTYTR
jgi:hypothetical protein